MKKAFFFVLAVCLIKTYAQTDSTEKIIRTKASIKLSAKHRKMVQFTELDMSNTFDFQDWMKDYFRASQNEDKTKFINSKMILNYSKNYSSLIVTFNLKKGGLVSNVEITGRWKEVAELLLTYWERPLRIDETKRGEIVWFNSFADRVSFLSADGISAKILISNNGIKTFQ
jgi:hypothetical protein